MAEKKDCYYIEEIAAVINDEALTEEERAEKVRTGFLALLLKDADCARRYVKMRDEAEDYMIKEASKGILAAVGRMIVGTLKIYQHSGADYKMLISVLNADFERAAEIEKNEEQDFTFEKLILKYDLADKNYPEIKEALIAYALAERGMI